MNIKKSVNKTNERYLALHVIFRSIYKRGQEARSSFQFKFEFKIISFCYKKIKLLLFLILLTIYLIFHICIDENI